MADENINLNLNLNADNSLRSLTQLRTELKELNKQMTEASNTGDKVLFNKLKERFTQTKDAMKDFREETVPLEDKLSGLTRYIGQSISVFSNLGLAMGADKKSMEDLMKSFAKVQALTNVAQGVAQLTADFGKMKTQLVSVGQDVAKMLGPAGLIAAGVIALGAAITATILKMIELSTVTNEAERTTELMNEATDKAIVNSIKEKVEYGNLFNALKNVNLSSEQRAAVIKKINDSGYVDNLLTEKSSIEDINTAQIQLNNNLLKKYKLQALEEQLVEAYKAQAQAMKDLKDADDGFLTNAFDFLLKTTSGLNVNVVATYNQIDAIDRSKEAAQDKMILEKQIAATLNDNTNLLDEYTDAEDKNTTAKKENITISKLQWRTLEEENKKIQEASKNTLKQIFSEETLKDMGVGGSILQQFLYGDDPEKVISDFKTYLDEGFKSLANSRSDIESEQPKGIDGKPKGWLWNTLLGPAPKEAKAEAISIASDVANSTGSIFQSLGDVIGEETRKGAILSRTGALFEIGSSMASAIASAVKAGAANPLNATTFGAAGAATFASMVAQIVAGIAQAKSVLSQPLPEFATGGLIEGQYTGRDNQLIRAMPGEAIINRSATQRYAPVLSAINQSTGGSSIGGSSAPIIDYDLLASKLNDKKVILVTSDVNDAQSRQMKRIQRARLK